MATHYMFDKRLQIYRRNGGRYWQCATRIDGVRHRQTTKEESLDCAKDVAEEWYLDLRGKSRRGEIVTKEKTFADAAELYLRDAEVLTAGGVRSPQYVDQIELRLNVHILPFFGHKPLSQINKGLAQQYRVHRAEKSIKKTGKPPARSTMLQEFVIIRQALKHVEGLGWIPFVPSLQTPYMTQTKKGRRAWFSPEEYEQLYKATRRRIKEGKRPGWKSHYEDMHDFVLFMANTGLRPDEAKNLEFRDVTIIEDYETGDIILSIDVRGKTGSGFCKSMPGAVHPFKRLLARRRSELGAKEMSDQAIDQAIPTTSVFRPFNRLLFNKILTEEGLKHDRDGQPRTAYSLRHTYISMRLLDGAKINTVANNCRTSVKMIEEHYAAHIRDRINPADLNMRRPKAARKSQNKHDWRKTPSQE